MKTLRYKFKKKNSKYPYIILIGVVLSVLFLAIGYSVYQAGVDISDITATVRVQKDIRVSEITPSNPVSGAVSNWVDYDVHSISSNVTLPNSDSTITYLVKVTNIGNIEAGITSISGLSSNLEYSISNYNVGDVICDDNDVLLCKLGAVGTIEIIISYADGGYDSNNTTHNINLDFDFFYLNAVARIGSKYYESLDLAIADVDLYDPKTTIELLSNTSGILSVAEHKDIVLDLRGNELSNIGNAPVFENLGSLEIKNGTIRSDASANGALNNQSTGVLVVDNVNVFVTGGRQAVYNNKGNATIKGNSVLKTTTNQRATVQNITPGVLTILSADITSLGTNGVMNTGTLVIGVEDGVIDNDSIRIQGMNYGVNSSVDFSLFDGYVYGKNKAFINDNRITSKEEGALLFHEKETIDEIIYDLSYAAFPVTITFDPNGGAVSESSRSAATSRPIGDLPTPTRSSYMFIGWFTERDGGEEITASEIVNGPDTYYAHWEKMSDVARIDNTKYDSLQEAINAVPGNTQTTITLLKDTSEAITITSSKKIILDLDNYTLRNSGNAPVIENSGNLTIVSGTITSTAYYSAINQNSGTLNITGGRVIATTDRQAVYINAGTVNISGDAYLSSNSSGTPTTSIMERGTVQCLPNGTLNITGGHIVGVKQQAVSNEGILNIGVKDGVIDSTTPVLEGAIHGVRTTGTFNYYDGVIKGVADAINGSITDMETGAQVVNGSEVKDGVTYITNHLEIP